jgi:hypothetical protein
VTIGLGQRFVGSIDELLLLDAALSAEQVQALFASGGKLKSVWH